MSPGYQTTEFWTAIAIVLVQQVIVLLTVFGVVDFSDQQKAAVISVCETLSSIAAGIYMIWRSKVKVAALQSSPPPPAA